MLNSLKQSEIIGHYFSKQLGLIYSQFINVFNYNLVYENELVEHPDSYTISIYIPGFIKDEITVEALANEVFIKAKHVVSNEDKQFIKVSSGDTYEQTFHLHSAIISDEIFANYYNGILEVYLPKAVQPKVIPIEENEIPTDDMYYDEDWNKISSQI